MIEEVESTASVPEGKGEGAKAAGALIKRARENMGTHIGALAVALKVPVRKLEALEAGELATLSGPVFVRALASSVCRHLKMDATEVLSLLPQAQSLPFSQPPELKTPFRVHGEGGASSASSRFLTTPVLAVLALLVGALAVAFWPERVAIPDAEPVAQNPAREMQVLPPSEPASVPTIAPPIPAPVVAVSAPSAIPAGSASAPVRPASAPLAVVKVSAGAAVPGETGILTFKAKDQSWVEVVDAKGDAVLRRTLQSGEVANVNGVLPLRVIVGRIDATEVTVRGRKLDMTTISKDNVGRFEVGQ